MGSGRARRGVVVVTLVASTVVVLGVLVPLAALWALWNAAARADDEAAALDARFVVAPAAPLGRGTAALLSARRIPAELVEPRADRALAERLGALAGLLPAESCMVVQVDGRPLVAHQPDTPLIPASVEKLATATAVLDHLRPDERFATRVVTASPVVDGVVTGDVWLVGGGDPLLATPEYVARAERQPQLRTPFEDLARAMSDQGIVAVEGRIFGDDGRYDQLRSVTTWPARYLTSGTVGPLSALSMDDGLVPETAERYVPAPDPPLAAARRFATDLAALGIAVGGEARSGPAPPDATVLVEVLSPPLEDIIGQLLGQSDNNTGELLTKELGLRLTGSGSTDTGRQVITASLAERDTDPSHYVVADGSGLDRGNLQTCGLAHALVAAAPPGSVIGDGLAVAGRTGTLANRFAESPLAGLLRAKTGTLSGVVGLAGYAVTGAGTITFAQILNGLPAAPDAGEDLQDRLVADLATYPEQPGLDEVAPPAPPA